MQRETEAAERALRRRADPRGELRGIAERLVRVEGEVVGDERGVRPEEGLEAPALPPVDDERLVAPEEPVVDEHHVGADVLGVLEQGARARDTAEQQRHLVRSDHLQARRRELRPAFDLEQRVRVGDDLVPFRPRAQPKGSPLLPNIPGRGAGTLWALGVWRSLVARSVRVGEVPSSNLGTPISRRPVIPAWGSPAATSPSVVVGRAYAR